MKRLIVPMTIGLGVLLLAGWTMYFLYQKSREKPITFETETAAVMDIVKKTVATGAIVPRKEVAIKPRISGVVDELLVEPGKLIKKGDLIARIKIIPNMVNLNAAESRVKTAQVQVATAEKELTRFQGLYDRKIISETDLVARRLEFELAKQEVSASQSNLQLIREGASRGSGKVSNEVTSTVDGMVLDVPVEEGFSVIETNNFNEGTTIATVANMKDLLFKGTVDEAEVAKIKPGMELSIRIGALDGHDLKGTLEYISPKGVAKEGAIQFEIRAAIQTREDVFVRANYSANADIVLDRREKVLAIREALIQFDKAKENKPYVEVEVGPQKFERRDIEVGLSDGIHSEVAKGVSEKDKIKKPLARGDVKGG